MSTSPTDPAEDAEHAEDLDGGDLPVFVDTTALEMRVVHRDGVPRPDPERYLVAPRIVTPEGARYVLLRWPDWPPPTLLSVQLADWSDTLEVAVSDALRARLGVEPAAPPSVAASRLPVRMRHPSMGSESVGWLRPVGIDVVGEPRPDALLAEVVVLTLEEALDALASDVERAALRGAARALGEEAAP